MMINPETLDLTSLPWLPLEEKSAFPKKSAIYFAIDSLGTIQYIGRSLDVHQRWLNHHKYKTLNDIGNIKIAYLFIDAVELLPEIEAALIDWFNPPLNISHRYKTKANQDGVKVICYLKDLMDEKGINRLELSEKTGLAPTTIGRLYRNQASRFDVSTLEKLANYFELNSITQLLELKAG